MHLEFFFMIITICINMQYDNKFIVYYLVLRRVINTTSGGERASI
jgi:hypothetical protein